MLWDLAMTNLNVGIATATNVVERLLQQSEGDPFLLKSDSIPHSTILEIFEEVLFSPCESFEHSNMRRGFLNPERAMTQ